LRLKKKTRDSNDKSVKLGIVLLEFERSNKFKRKIKKKLKVFSKHEGGYIIQVLFD